jgi:hypothetical protein
LPRSVIRITAISNTKALRSFHIPFEFEDLEQPLYHFSAAKDTGRTDSPEKEMGGQTSITLAKDDEILRLYAKSDGQYAFIGLEAFPRRISRKSINHGARPKIMKKLSAKFIMQASILSAVSYMGLDSHDPSVVQRTLEFALNSRIAAAQYHTFTPFPGTRLYASLREIPHTRVEKVLLLLLDVYWVKLRHFFEIDDDLRSGVLALNPTTIPIFEQQFPFRMRTIGTVIPQVNPFNDEE